MRCLAINQNYCFCFFAEDVALIAILMIMMMIMMIVMIMMIMMMMVIKMAAGRGVDQEF